MKDLKKVALKNCDDIVKGGLLHTILSVDGHTCANMLLAIRKRRLIDFAACSQGRTISVAWACTDKWRAMQGCMREE